VNVLQQARSERSKSSKERAVSAENAHSISIPSGWCVNAARLSKQCLDPRPPLPQGALRQRANDSQRIRVFIHRRRPKQLEDQIGAPRSSELTWGGKDRLTPEILLKAPSGNLFGLTQNAGMGWEPQKQLGSEVLFLSTHGDLRGADGNPIALAFHIAHWELGALVAEAAITIKSLDAIPFAGACMHPCDGRTQGTTGPRSIHLKPLNHRDLSASNVVRHLNSSLAQVARIRLFMQPVRNITVDDRMRRAFAAGPGPHPQPGGEA
jgi:hypothetical protein